MRIHFYGVQGSGSVYPRLREREATREVSEYRLLERVFAELQERTDSGGRLDCRIEDILGGPHDRSTLLAFWRKIRPPRAVSYGGWTTCVLVESDGGEMLVFDCGSGFRNCAQDLQEKWGDQPGRELHLFGSHSHRDHTEGLDQAPVCFDPRNRITIYGNHRFLHALDEPLGIFSRQYWENDRQVHTPVSYKLMPASFTCRLIESENGGPAKPLAEFAEATHHPGEPIMLGDVTVTPFELFHPSPCLGYCVESGGRKFIFATDHELRRAPNDSGSAAQAKSLAAEERLIRYATGADLLYRDGQYLRSEYDGEKGIGEAPPIPRLDWGHSCIEDVEEMALACGVKRTLIGHHDPNREWAERQWIDQSLSRHAERGAGTVELAQAETVIDL